MSLSIHDPELMSGEAFGSPLANSGQIDEIRLEEAISLAHDPSQIERMRASGDADRYAASPMTS